MIDYSISCNRCAEEEIALRRSDHASATTETRLYDTAVLVRYRDPSMGSREQWTEFRSFRAANAEDARAYARAYYVRVYGKSALGELIHVRVYGEEQ